MSKLTSYKDASKIDWAHNGDDNGFIGHERIAIGCQMRIADALEVIAKDKVMLQDQLTYLEKRNEALGNYNYRL